MYRERERERERGRDIHMYVDIHLTYTSDHTSAICPRARLKHALISSKPPAAVPRRCR